MPPRALRARTAVCSGLLTLASLWSASAYAALPPITYHGLRPPQPTALVLAEEFVVISCPPAQDVLRCTVSAHYVVGNPSADPVEADAPVVAAGVTDLRVVQDGTPSPKQPWELRIALAPGARTVIDVTFSLAFSSRAATTALGSGGPIPAVEARHPVLGGDTRGTPAHPVFFEWSRNWAAVQARNFDVRYPGGWKLHGSQWRAQGAVTERSVSADLASVDTPVDVDLRKVQPVVPIVQGGPVVAVGSALGEGFRMRYGYEFGIFDWMIPSVTADVDYAGLLVLSPTVDAATSAKLPMPSLSAGLGLPVRVRPETRAGARLKLSAVLAIGLEATIDYYPSDGDWDTTLAARLSL